MKNHAIESFIPFNESVTKRDFLWFVIRVYDEKFLFSSNNRKISRKPWHTLMISLILLANSWHVAIKLLYVCVKTSKCAYFSVNNCIICTTLRISTAYDTASYMYEQIIHERNDIKSFWTASCVFSLLSRSLTLSRKWWCCNNQCMSNLSFLLHRVVDHSVFTLEPWWCVPACTRACICVCV